MIDTCLFGDCRISLNRIKQEGITVQTCVTSPPYYGLRDYGHSGQIGLEQTPDEYINNLVEVFRGVKDVLTDDGTLWVNIGDSYYNYRPGKGQRQSKQSIASQKYSEVETCGKRGNKLEGYKEKDLMGIPWMLAFALRNDGWYLRQDIIWSKPNPMPESVKDRCTKSHEYIFLFSKNQDYYFDSEAIKEPAVDTGLRQKRSVWNVQLKPYKEAHFAVYPTELIEPCILAGSRSGDIVLDPFFGSGTTGEVAERLGRNWIGCELNSEYKELQDKRLGNTILNQMLR